MLFSKNVNKVSAIGSGLVDFLVRTGDDFIENLGIEKGGMTLVNMDTIDKLLKKIPGKPIIVPGGAACNTIVGIAKLGGITQFIGKIGSDKIGNFFKNSLIKHNVGTSLLGSELPTGRVVSIITPDAQRTMLTALSASSEILPQEINSKDFKGSKIVHIEGYLLFNADLIISILESAKSSGALISLDLASFTVVNQNIELLNYLIPKYVDILIGNEDEAKAYTKLIDEKLALKYMSKNTIIAVVKMGNRGSWISYQDSILRVNPITVKNVIDTTGAGDLWAAGFLFGLAKGLSLEKCGKIASICGGEVCKIIGANISNNIWHKINRLVFSSHF